MSGSKSAGRVKISFRQSDSFAANTPPPQAKTTLKKGGFCDSTTVKTGGKNPRSRTGEGGAVADPFGDLVGHFRFLLPRFSKFTRCFFSFLRDNARRFVRVVFGLRIVRKEPRSRGRAFRESWNTKKKRCT